MWKDWLSFTRKEQYGLVLLTFLIVILLAVRVLMPLFSKPAEIELISDIDFLSEPAEPAVGENKEVPRKKTEKSSYHFFQFNPNTVSVTELSEMGFSPFVIVNWMKYREAGGFFKREEDVGKIYGLDPLTLKEMRAFLYFNSADRQTEARKVVELQEDESFEHVVSEEKKELSDSENQMLRIDINRADTARLRLIRGIGPVFSQRIVDFRKLLGGFYSVDQLGEVYGFPPDLTNSVREYLIVNPEDVKKLAVNSFSLRALKAHPYISFYQAKEIVEYRRRNGIVTGREVLNEFSSFDKESLEKVLPYLSFEEK
jgi:competence protein ComEA